MLNKTYVYAQSKDNSGSSKCWEITFSGFKLLDYDSEDAGYLISQLDLLSGKNKLNIICLNEVECFFKFNGDFLVKVNPIDLDNSGRVYPVLILTNINLFKRNILNFNFLSVERIENRSFSNETKKELKELILFLNRSLLYKYFFIFASKIKGCLR